MSIPDKFVLDASVAVAWAIASEATPLTEALFETLRAGGEALAPAIWPMEVANALLVAERASRISPANIAAFAQILATFAITIEPGMIKAGFDQTLSIARQMRLTTYDASYIELAGRRAFPLATLDERLAQAAQSLGITVLS